ncbi:MAG: flagellar basal body L-ring protein FlgH [Candidatus Hydrogenedentes bacterium]|nr:flagellar basal body L-ring protein FlgH [Candidatus Hydrogenedentota bacterium]
MKRMVLFILLISLFRPGIVRADSLFTPEAQMSGSIITEMPVKFQPGDIITVLVREKVSASTTADTNTKKESDVESKANENSNKFLTADEPNGFGLLNPEQLPNWKIEAENETKARGKTTRSSTLTTTIACVVTQVYPNGTLKIEGQKRVTVNREDTILHIAGIVRARDVAPDNTVLSTQVANAEVQLKGKGDLWNNQRRGLITKLLDWFSPF